MIAKANILKILVGRLDRPIEGSLVLVAQPRSLSSSLFRSAVRPIARLAACSGDGNSSEFWSLPLHFLDGNRVQSTNPSIQDDFDVKEPATGKVLTTTRCSSGAEVDRAVQSSRAAFVNWSQLSGLQRSKILRKAADLIRFYHEDVARVEVHDTGKPIWEARMDIEGCCDTLEYYAGLTANLTGEQIPMANGCFAYTRREPLGVVGAIGAWNYPSQMVVWKSAPALACGNTMVFKPSPLTPFSTAMLADIYSEAGLPDGVFNVVQGGAEVGQMLSEHPDVAKMTFTGSVRSGSKVMEACARGIKHVTLELGGKSPLIIFNDADLKNAVSGAILANFLSQGQVCSNGTRVFVHNDVWEEFVSKFVTRTKSMKIGNPMNDDTTVGATISREQFEKAIGYVSGAVGEGAKILCGGERHIPTDTSLSGGYYLKPCILTDVSDEMTVAKEEVFGSVACLFRFSDEAEVVARANDTEFGLAGGVFTRDLARAHRVAAALQSGSVYVNNYNVFCPGVSFGGYKKSGIGRENGPDAFHHYTQVKSVYVETGDVWCPL